MKTLKTLGKIFIPIILFCSCGSGEQRSDEGVEENSEVEYIDTLSIQPGSKPIDSTEYGECSCPFQIKDESFSKPEMRISFNGTDLAFCGPVEFKVSDTMVIFTALQIWDCWRKTTVLEYNRPGWTLRLQKVGDRNMEIVEMIDLPRGEGWTYKPTSIFEAYLVSEDEYGIYSFTTPQIILNTSNWTDLNWKEVSEKWESVKSGGQPLSALMLDQLFLWAGSQSVDGALAFIDARNYPHASEASGRYEVLLQIWETLNPPGLNP